MSHGNHAHQAQDEGHTHGMTQHNPPILTPEQEVAAAKEAEKAAAQKLKDEKRAEKEAARQKKADEREAKKAERAAEREAKNTNKDAERQEKAAKRAEEREAKKAAGAEAKAIEKEAKRVEREAAKEASKEQREADKQSKLAEKEAAKLAKKEERQLAVAERAALVEARKADTKITGERRAKATHIVYTGEGFSSPQSVSTRGKVLEYIKANCEVGVPVKIEDLAKACKPFLYGASVRSFLSKLEERGHLDFVTVEEVPAENAAA